MLYFAKTNDYIVLYRRGTLAALYVAKTDNFIVVDYAIKCPKNRLYKVAEFPTEREATSYVIDQWDAALHKAPVEGVKIRGKK